jgi:KDO2-lipid IV(A) lauroyltransferase
VTTLTRPSTWSRRQRLKNDAIYVAARIALALASLPPRAWLRAFGAALGLTAWCLARGARRLAGENVARAFPALPARETSRRVRRAFVELGRLLGDTLALLRADERPSRTLAFDEPARGVLAAALAEARDAGSGVILVTAHLGPWERLAAVLVEAGFPLTTPVRTSYDPRLEATLHARLRGQHGVRAVDRDAKSTPYALLRALKRGEVVGFLIDLQTRVASVRVPFLGVPAWTPSAPARLALRTGAPVVVAIATRAGVTVRLVRAASEPRQRASDGEVEALTTTLNDVLSEAIRAEPERWIWMHDRFGERRALGGSAVAPIARAEPLDDVAGEISG